MDNRAVFKMTPGRAALVGLMNCYLRGLLDPFVTLLEVHKLMYFMQAAGEPLKLQFVKATYGPYRIARKTHSQRVLALGSRRELASVVLQVALRIYGLVLFTGGTLFKTMWAVNQQESSFSFA